jgi:endonuclease YncB( thermonuclease family)
MVITLKHFALPQRGGASLGANFGGAVGAAQPARTEPATMTQAGALRGGHAAEVVRVIDGDTFEARVRIWPGMEVTTRVRLRGIDAPEMHARCEDERVKALNALVRILGEGKVGISRIGQDKYGGRVDADVSTARTSDVSAAMFERGLARRYSGGRRESWCG